MGVTENRTRRLPCRPSVRLELGDEIREHPCETCGRPIRSGHGDVLDGDDVSARYWFDTEAHGDDRRTRLLVVLDSARSRRWFYPGVSFVVHGRVEPGGLAFSLAGPADSPVVPDRRVSGRTLTRRRALKHARLSDLWRIVDALVERDPTLATFLSGSST